MQRMLWLIAVLVVVAAACSSSEPMAVEFAMSMNPDAESPGASGPAVDEGIVCAEGDFERIRMEHDGVPVSDEEGMAMWEEAMESGSAIEMVLYEEYNCSDGSGSLSFVVDNVVTPSQLDFEGKNDAGTWEIRGGTGSYEGHEGEGGYHPDFGTGLVYYSGEVQEG